MTEATAVNGIEDVLEQCGVSDTTLSASDRDALDHQGYIVLRGIVDAEWLSRLRDAFEKACDGDQQASRCRETGTRHVGDLMNRDPAFDGVCAQPSVLAATYHVLRCSFRLAQAGGRDPLPGFGQQGLHADWMARERGEPFRIVTAIWLLDDFTPENGATRVVPGTHLLLTSPPKSFADPASRHREQKLITAGAGSVLVFNGHLWHSGTRNGTKRARRVLQCQFIARDEYRFSSVKMNTPERLTPAARYIVGL